MGLIKAGRQTRWGFAEGATFLTKVADASAFTELAIEGGIEIVPDVHHNVAERFRGKRVDDLIDVFNDSYGSMPSASLKMPALKDDLAFWLYLMFQNVSEDVDPFEKTFTFPANSPDFAADAGMFGTLAEYNPVASKSQNVASMIGEKLVLSCSSESDFMRLYCALDLKGGGFTRNANPSGTWTPTPRDYFPFHLLQSFQIDSSNIVLESFTLTITNTIFPAGFDSAGGFQNLVITKHDVEAEIVGIWDTVMDGQGIGAKFDSGAEAVLTANWGTDDADGFLDIVMRGVVSDYKNLTEDKLKASFSLKGTSDIANTNEILTMVLADGVDRSW